MVEAQAEYLNLTKSVVNILTEIWNANRRTIDIKKHIKWDFIL